MSPATALQPAADGIARIAAAFARAAAERRAALIPYVMAGDPDLAGSIAFAEACAQGGADLLELGVPFSDPVADGPVIQRAGERALRNGTTLTDVLDAAAVLGRRTEVPILLMSYLNPILSLGGFAKACAKARVAGVIIPDVPPEELGDLGDTLLKHRIATVSFLSPVTTPERRAAALKAATGFVYFVSVTGVTGARRALPPELPRQLAAARDESPVPVVVGFGVSTPAQARQLGRSADGVVVGSAIVAKAAAPGPLRQRAAAVRAFVSSLRNAL